MAAIVWADVVKIDAALSAVDPAAQVWFLAHVNTALDVRRFDGEEDPRLRLARTYLAAHFGAVAITGAGGGASAAGPVSAEAAGTLSRSYASITSSSSDPLLDTTSWGRMYRMLIRPARGGCTL